MNNYTQRNWTTSKQLTSPWAQIIYLNQVKEKQKHPNGPIMTNEVEAASADLQTKKIQN